jgi:hypothetical protein
MDYGELSEIPPSFRDGAVLLLQQWSFPSLWVFCFLRGNIRLKITAQGRQAGEFGNITKNLKKVVN